MPPHSSSSNFRQVRIEAFLTLVALALAGRGTGPMVVAVVQTRFRRAVVALPQLPGKGGGGVAHRIAFAFTGF